MKAENVLKGNYKNHFMEIIIYLEKAIDFSSREYFVIDGQQRLTTTFLLVGPMAFFGFRINIDITCRIFFRMLKYDKSIL